LAEVGEIFVIWNDFYWLICKASWCRSDWELKTSRYVNFEKI